MEMVVRVSKPEDIPNLPWKGNFRDDEELLDACNEYICNEENIAKKYQAERLTHRYGLGIELPEIPTKDSLEYLATLKPNTH